MIVTDYSSIYFEMASFKTLIKIYVLFAILYSVPRKLEQVWGAHVVTYDAVTFRPALRPMLLGFKFLSVMLAVPQAPFMLPVWIIGDLNRLDVYMRGQCLEQYGVVERVNIEDYLFGF